MVIAIGTDIVEIARIAEVLERQGERFIDRILTVSEKTLYTRAKVFRLSLSVLLQKKPWRKPWVRALVVV